MGRGLLLTALALGLASAPSHAAHAHRQLQDGGTPGTCIEAYAVSGYSFEDGQDETSLQVSAAVVVPRLWSRLWLLVASEGSPLRLGHKI